MGAMKAPEKPQLPDELAYLYDTYRSLKFFRVKNESHDPQDKTSPAFKLIPRGMVEYNELESFCNLSGLNLQPWEVETIMNIDGIFENSRGG